MSNNAYQLTVWSLLIDEAYTSIKDNYILAQVSRSLRQIVESRSRKLFRVIELQSLQGNEIISTSTSGTLNPKGSLVCRLNKLVILEKRQAKMDIPCFVILTKREFLWQQVYTTGLEARFPLPFPRKWGIFKSWLGTMNFAPYLQTDYLFVEGERIDQLSVIRMHSLDFRPRFILPLGWTIDIKEKYLTGNIMMATFLRFYSRKRHWRDAEAQLDNNLLDPRDLLILDLERWAYRTVDLYRYFEEKILPSTLNAINTHYNISPSDFAEVGNLPYSQMLALPKAISFKRNHSYQRENSDGLNFPFTIDGTNEHITMKISGRLQFRVPYPDSMASIHLLNTEINALIISTTTRGRRNILFSVILFSLGRKKISKKESFFKIFFGKKEKRFFFQILFSREKKKILFSKSFLTKKEKDSFFEIFFRSREKRF